jgi:hypothetical protein
MSKGWLRRRIRDSITCWHELAYGKCLVARRQGLRLLFDLDNVADKYLLAFGTYENRQKHRLFKAASEGVLPGQRNVFIDIGAHSGLYSLWAQRTGMFDRIIAIEADPRNFAQLKTNLFLNRAVTAIDAIEAAASSTAGEIAFYLVSAKKPSQRAGGGWGG